MCEQTEINYLDGDIVWVKLGACWWPGQVTGFHNLPEDIQDEFQKKPLIAAVKFFQEDTYEFVKNYQQIYKYNCTLKDEFIKKGLDKYRSKSKDGSRYMDKFPGDVEMAEKLTGGDPDILSHDKFCPEEKPDISALFGEKKLPKKKRDRDETHRRSDSFDIVRKITHPRFLKESDHEVRIRQQPSSLPSTPSSTGSPVYPCHLCSFTSSRVNVIICHIKSHRSGNSPTAKSRVKSFSQARSRYSDTDTPKRKYARKEKSQASKSKNENRLESGKRKQPKQVEKVSKKKKTDPQIRDTILADWEDESDEDLSLNQSKPLDISSIISSPTKGECDSLENEESKQNNHTMPDSNEIIEEAEKLLRETEKLTSINMTDDSLTSNIANNLKSGVSDGKPESETDTKISDSATDESTNKSEKERETSNSDSESKHAMYDKDDKKALLSCFDFHEEEPSIPPVRKKARAFHQKKEIIKEFELSQAMKIEHEKENDNEKSVEPNVQTTTAKNDEAKEDVEMQTNTEDTKAVKENDKVPMEVEESTSEKPVEEAESKTEEPEVTTGETDKKAGGNACETEVEIVEIFEVEKEEVENTANVATNEKKEEENKDDATETIQTEKVVSENEASQTNSADEKQSEPKDAVPESKTIESVESAEQTSSKETEETSSERFTTETEDETVSESAETLPGQSENSDTEMMEPDQVPSKDPMDILLNNQELNVGPKAVKKRRGRPRKNTDASRTDTSGTESPKLRDTKSAKKLSEKIGTDRRTSESDTERSYSGRKRKPNKKYLESDIYDTDQRASKTDDSQSESDDKTFEKIQGKSRRSKRSLGIDKKKTESVEDIEEKELELSQHSLVTADNQTNVLKLNLTDNSSEGNINKEKMTVETVDKPFDSQPEVDVSEKLKESAEVAFSTKESDMLSFTEEVKTPMAENSSDKIDKTISDLTKIDSGVETDQLLEPEKFDQENLKNFSGLSTSTFQLDSCPEKEELPQQPEPLKSAVDMLPPKKSQIKKFELSQIDFFDDNASPKKIGIDPEPVPDGRTVEKPEEVEKMETEVAKDAVQEEKTTEVVTEKEDPTVKTDQIETKVEETVTEPVVEKKSQENIEVPMTEELRPVEVPTQVSPEKPQTELKPETVEETPKEEAKPVSEQQTLKRSSMQTRYKGKFTPETGAKSKKDREMFLEEKPVNTFQEAFLKTLQIDKKKGTTDDNDVGTGKGKKGKKTVKRKLDEQDTGAVTSTASQEVKLESSSEKIETSENVSKVQAQEANSQVTIVGNFEGMEVVVDQNIEIDTKVADAMFQNVSQQLASSSAEFGMMSKSLPQSPIVEDTKSGISLDMQKIDESSRMSMSTPSPSSDVTVPVKKREMPRIIENVTLTEPMQILKSKLLDKMPQKGVKHKLDTDGPKKADQKGSPKAKIMKLESAASNSKTKTGPKVTSPHLSIAKKLQVLKAEEGESATATETQNEQMNVQISQTTATTSVAEKFIAQTSQSLADMELDINSMPFVLSDDLTPESIEQMPVVISSIIPASSTMAATLSFTPTTQIISATQSQFKLTSESSGETSPTKKKSGTPAILKNKNKAKPTITSIKTLVPPLTGGVKGIKFQNAPAAKAPVLTQKAQPGKYVVVQTAGGQQLRYTVQGKPGTTQKIAIPAAKGAANAQVVQQGGKVVILTSAQSGQTKMLPLNISKSLGGKVQRIMTNKGQVFCPISPQGIIASKTIIAPKTDGVSPTTSKLPPGHKIINTQGIIQSKAVLTPIPGTIAKTTLLGTIPQGILTKSGVYTSISASALGAKTIIGSKTLVAKGATILSQQSLGASKAILTPISQAIGGKPILSSPGMVNAKGTVLTPITGQQVKAIAAKSPTKGGKVQYQPVQQKVQLPALQKTQKVPMSVAQGRSGQAKTSTSTLVLQNTSTGTKTVQQGKKVIKQTLVQGASMQNIAQGSGQQTIGMMPQVQQKGKAAATSTVQKVVIPRGGSRQVKAQQKIVVQKTQEPTISTVQTIQSKQTISMSPTMTTSKTLVQQKQVSGTATTSKLATKIAAGKNAQQQKNLLNAAMNSVVTTSAGANLSTTLSLPPLEPIETEKKTKVENVMVESVQKEQPKAEKFSAEKSTGPEKIDEPKIPAQPQIMALPTESSDGTQTYVLVTIDEQGQIQPLDNNTLMSLEGTTQNPDGTRTLYIDPSSLGEAGTLDNIVLQFDNGVLPNIQTSGAESTQTIISESFPTSEVMQTSNQDILAAALANTDFQQEINLPENPAGSVMTTGLTQTSLINQTILQSTIIPPTEPISSPSVLETSLTLNQPIMTPLEVPSSLPIQSEATPTSTVSTIPSSLELPITITNPSISYISAGEAQIQIPGNSMPDIGEIMENSGTSEIVRADIPVSTQYLVIPNLEDNIAVDTQNVVQTGAISMPSVSYSVSLSNNLVLESPQVQTTPSMPIIDDGYTENVQFTTSIEPSMATEQTFVDVPVSEMLVSKASVSTDNAQAQDVTVTSGMVVSHDIPVSAQEPTASTSESGVQHKEEEATKPLPEVYSSQEVPITSEELILQQPVTKQESTPGKEDGNAGKDDSKENMEVEEQTGESMTSSMPIIDETPLVSSDSNGKISSAEPMNFEVTDSGSVQTNMAEESKTVDKFKELSFSEQSSSKLQSPTIEEQATTSNEVEPVREGSEILPAESLNRLDEQNMNIEDADSKVYSASTVKHSEDCQRDEPSSQGESSDLVQRNLELHFDETSAETSHETPSQSYEQFGIAMTSDSADLPSQSAAKSENSREPSQSITYEPMETDEEAIVAEPPTQSFEDSKMNEASQSYETSAEANTNAPTQSFNELLQSQEERPTVDESIDDQTFPTQSYEVGKTENVSENLETDAEISQEGNIPSQSNDIGADGIGTSSVSTNNSGLNEDETASSSYVPETPENQERDQDQESAISTSSYEIPPCEELNIASSSVIPDTSVRAEHTSIHDNGVPEIPTSSYNLNPDITSTHVDSVPTSSYEDQVIVEQNVSTSYEVPISMPGLEETCSQNFVTESTDHRNEPSSYYTHHQEVTASYYESVHQETNSRLEEDPQEEVTPSYYEGNPQEASQSYFTPEEATQSYSSHNVSPRYYDPRPESEASQSYYSTDDIEKTEQSSSQNIEASQSFYQEQSEELKLRQGEATPTYTERYPVDYTLENSPIERHDLVESSVPATRPTER